MPVVGKKQHSSTLLRFKINTMSTTSRSNSRRNSNDMKKKRKMRGVIDGKETLALRVVMRALCGPPGQIGPLCTEPTFGCSLMWSLKTFSTGAERSGRGNRKRDKNQQRSVQG